MLYSRDSESLNQLYRLPDSVNGVLTVVELEDFKASSVGVGVASLVVVLLSIEAVAVSIMVVILPKIDIML